MWNLLTKSQHFIFVVTKEHQPHGVLKHHSHHINKYSLSHTVLVYMLANKNPVIKKL